MFTFPLMKDLAEKHNITFTWFCGEPGHGGGLADAMSSFGCKSPLQHLILIEDKWLENAEEMHNYLDEYFENNDKNTTTLLIKNTQQKYRKQAQQIQDKRVNKISHNAGQ